MVWAWKTQGADSQRQHSSLESWFWKIQGGADSQRQHSIWNPDIEEKSFKSSATLTKPALKIQNSSKMTWTKVSAPRSTPDFCNYIRCSDREDFLLSSPWPLDDNIRVPPGWFLGHQDSASHLSVQVTRGALGRTVYFSLCFNLFPCSVLCENIGFFHVFPLFCVVGPGMISKQHPSGLSVLPGCTFVQSKHFGEVMMKMWREEQKTWRHKNTTVLEEQVSHRHFNTARQKYRIKRIEV